MNLGLATTYIIGGLMLISILAYNHSVFNSTVETTSSVITQSKLDNIVSILQNDLSRIGYETGASEAFVVAEDTVVTFRGNIFDNDGSDDFDLVEWIFTGVSDATTTNPNDFILIRRWNQTPNVLGNAIEFQYSVSDFSINYYNLDGDVPTDIEDIVQIEVEVLVESNEPYLTKKDGTELYYRTYWKRRVVANNLIY
tara:strand:+ start:1874 stop:2464 length:591 start_codon:yes stop_codon:yes gene_type:complete